MKKIIVSIISLVIFVSLGFTQSQSKKITYKVTHNWIKKISSVEYMSKSKIEHYQYVWGNRDNEYTEKNSLTIGTNATLYEEIPDNSEHYGYSWKTDEYIIYRNLETATSYDVIRMLTKLYVIEDTITNQNWKILNDLREIAGHICMSASYYDETKNSNIIAWFALDWPISIGPEHYCGLPGVILEININNGAKIITAEKIEELEENVVIEKPNHKKKHKKINYSEYRKLIANYYEESKKDERPYFYGIRY